MKKTVIAVLTMLFLLPCICQADVNGKHCGLKQSLINLDPLVAAMHGIVRPETVVVLAWASRSLVVQTKHIKITYPSGVGCVAEINKYNNKIRVTAVDTEGNKIGENIFEEDVNLRWTEDGTFSGKKINEIYKSALLA